MFKKRQCRESKRPIGQNLLGLNLIFCLSGWAMFSVLKFFFCTLVYDKLTLLWKKKFRQLKVNLFTTQNSQKKRLHGPHPWGPFVHS